MKIVNLLIITIIALLSIAAGLAKVMQSQQEVEFLLGQGLNSFLITGFGLVQIIGGVLLVPKKTRMSGAILVALAFVVSTVLIFISDSFKFGLFSIIPIALVGVIIHQSAREH